jgi:hypothetical protein
MEVFKTDPSIFPVCPYILARNRQSLLALHSITYFHSVKGKDKVVLVANYDSKKA